MKKCRFILGQRNNLVFILILICLTLFYFINSFHLILYNFYIYNSTFHFNFNLIHCALFNVVLLYFLRN